MVDNIYLKKKIVSSWFKTLKEIICYEFETIEKDYGKKSSKKPKLFISKNWLKSLNKYEGGGTFSKINDGLVFEKVGVNFSEVWGKFDKKFANQIPGSNKNNSYWASGISVVAHMKNPKIPSLHFNTRFIVTSKNWFGGGIDATPFLPDKNEEKQFHSKIKSMCDTHNKKYYKKYKNWCDRYFYLKHRNETRGIGGIFFDYLKNNWEKNFMFTREVGLCFIDCSTGIIRKKMFNRWNKEQKNIQLIKRGRYVEFNLLYDRGTKFGLNTGGNTEAILMSLPPTVKWK